MSDRAIDELLAHSRWVKALARSLARDPGLAEDLEQDTWISALRRGPRDERSLRGWLATLLRRRLRAVRRGDARRSAREEHHARALAQPSTAEVVERAESQRDLVQAVLNLREPFRSTVLLRYIEELTPDEIAVRMGVPVPTVHSRLARGLAALRERFEREGRARPSWAGVLAWLRVGRPRPALRVLARASASGTGLVAGLVMLLACAWLGLAWRRASRAESDALASVEAAPASAPSRVPLDASGAREPVSVESASVDGPRAAERPLRTGHVLDPRGTPLAGVEVVLVADGAVGALGAGAAAPLARATSAPDGSFRFPAPATNARLCARDARHETVLECAVDPARTDDCVVVAAPRVALAGRVLAPDGAPLAHATLACWIAPTMELSYERALDFSRPATWFAESGADGSFRFDALPSLPEARLHVAHAGFETAIVPVPEESDDALEVRLAPPPEGVAAIRGSVLDSAGRPVARAEVCAFPAWTESDAAGRFELVLWPAPQGVRLVALVAGASASAYEPPLDDLGHPRWPETITLRLPERAGAIAGRVVDERGAPVAGARVWIRDPTPARMSARGRLAVESLAIDSEPPAWRSVESDATGAFVLDGLLEREYHVWAADPSTLAHDQRIARPGDSVRLELSAQEVEHIAGCVVDPRGRPLAGVAARLVRTAFPAAPDQETFADCLARASVVTDAEGRFELAGSARGTFLRLESDAILTVTFALDELEAHDDLRLVASVRAHLCVELEHGQAESFEARDGDGRTLLLTQLRAGCSHPRRRAELTNGRSLVLALSDEARELVFFGTFQGGEREVGRVPVALECGETNTVRW